MGAEPASASEAVAADGLEVTGDPPGSSGTSGTATVLVTSTSPVFSMPGAEAGELEHPTPDQAATIMATPVAATPEARRRAMAENVSAGEPRGHS